MSDDKVVIREDLRSAEERGDIRIYRLTDDDKAKRAGGKLWARLVDAQWTAEELRQIELQGAQPGVLVPVEPDKSKGYVPDTFVDAADIWDAVVGVAKGK